MNILPAKTTDEGILRLFSEHDDYMIDFLGDDRKYYTRYQENENIESVWMVMVDDLPAGCIAYRKKEEGTGEVKRMFIKEAYRGRGIAKKLLETVENYAKEQGCHKLFLDTRITLEPAVSLYRAFGFRIVFQQGLYIQMEKAIEPCLICERIEQTKNGKNPYFVKELNTGYVVIGDHQRIKGYSLFLCKEHATELHFLDPHFRDEFLHEMAIVAEAVYNAFQPDKLNYELLGAGSGVHMHWHLFPRRKGDTPTGGPVWSLGQELAADEYLPTPEELEDLKTRLRVELEKLL